MLERYTLSPMGFYWNEQHKLDTWAHVEIMAAIAQGAPESVIEALGDTPVPEVDEVAEEEARVHHDVVAFLNVWRRAMPAEVAAWVHKGMTSSDLVDTAMAVRLGESSHTINVALRDLCADLAQHALAHWDTPRLARTHGQAAEASTWGYRVADFALGLARAQQTLVTARRSALVAKLSGPVGNYRHTRFDAEARFADSLNLLPATVASQVIMRDRLSYLLFAYAQIASVIEAFALEIRLGSHFNVGELAEGRKSTQQAGSSAMPHKRNPITAEQLCGLAKIVRAQLDPVMQGIALWHERDISHSSVERLAIQTATVVTHYMVVKASNLVRGLVVDRRRMTLNIGEAGDATLSAWTKDQLIEYGLHPETAWSLVAEASQADPRDIIRGVNSAMAERGADLVLGYPDRLTPADTGHVWERLRALVADVRGVVWEREQDPNIVDHQSPDAWD